MRRVIPLAVVVVLIVVGGALYVSKATEALCAYEHKSYPVAVGRYRVLEEFLGSAAAARLESAQNEPADVARSDRATAAEYLHLKAINQRPPRPRC